MRLKGVAHPFTKTTRVQHDVLNLIATEAIGPGERIPTEKELARRLGASVTTIQRALAQLVNQDLIERTRGRGTFVKRRLTRGPLTDSLAFVLVNRTPLYYEHILNDARGAARLRNYGVMVLDAVDHPNDAIANQLSQVSGVLLSGVVTDEWLALMTAMRLPNVVVGAHRLTRRTHSVGIDFAAASSVAVRRLHALGCCRIGLVNGARTYLPATAIHDGYTRTLRELGLEWDARRIVWSRRGHRQEDLAPLLNSGEQLFDGLVVEGGSFLPLHLFFYEAGRVPTDTPLCVVPIGPILEEGMSRIHEVEYESTLGEAAVNLLFELMSGRDAPESVLIAPVAPSPNTGTPRGA